MEPSPKRPRLSIFSQATPDEELDVARYNNDKTLKNRFESIFAKYTRDFTGIGDEVDLMTGQVIVNNGHLESIQTETDLGIDHLSGEFSSVSRSMLRAMTVSLNPDLPGPDDVLSSIETIAANATLPYLSSESENNFSGSSTVSSQSRSRSNTGDIAESTHDTIMKPYNSDSDSLFGGEASRSGSVDSLFEGDSLDKSADISDRSPRLESSVATPLATSAVNEDEDIIARFGPHMGKEVLNLIGQQREAHIEPVWRIPVNLARHANNRPTTQVLSSSPIRSSSEARPTRSLWKLPPPRKKRPSREVSTGQEVREESIDPLQEDMISDTEPQAEAGDPEDHQLANPDSNDEDQVLQNILEQITATGNCPYCNIHFINKSGVMAHWDRLIRHPPKNSLTNEAHDMELIQTVRSQARIRIRFPRLVVYDFRTMVELHEGAGLSFDDIAASKTLRTHKTGLRLQNIYNAHRTPRNPNDPPVKVKEWTEVEEQTLQEMCQNPLATMTTLRRGLKSHDELEIGNYLADVWLSQLKGTQSQAEQSKKPTSIHSQVSRSAVSDENYPQPPYIKREDSGDELFS